MDDSQLKEVVKDTLDEAKKELLGPRIKRKPYVREYPKNFKKTWKELQKALSASEEFSLMWFLNLAKVLKDEFSDLEVRMKEEGVMPSGMADDIIDQFVAEVALKQSLVLLHPYDITTNKLVIS